MSYRDEYVTRVMDKFHEIFDIKKAIKRVEDDQGIQIFGDYPDLQAKFEASHKALKERLKLMYPEEHNKTYRCNCGCKIPNDVIKKVVEDSYWKPDVEKAMKDIIDGFNSKHFEVRTPDANETPIGSRDDPRNKAKRYNSGKPQLSYVMSTGVALDGVARVMEFGAKKYDRDNWKKGLNPTSILDSLIRHCRRYLDGEYIDNDSGLPHIDHIACNALFLGYHTNRETQDGMKK